MNATSDMDGADELEALRASVEGLNRAPSDEELQAVLDLGGSWVVTAREFHVHSSKLPVLLGVRDALHQGPSTGLDTLPVRWIALAPNGRPIPPLVPAPQHHRSVSHARTVLRPTVIPPAGELPEAEHQWTSVQRVTDDDAVHQQVWQCAACGACAGWCLPGRKPPTIPPFFPDRSGLRLSHDCNVARQQIALHRGDAASTSCPCAMHAGSDR